MPDGKVVMAADWLLTVRVDARFGMVSIYIYILLLLLLLVMCLSTNG